jgi:transcriptional regulator with XRE-family HTH domain
MGADAISAFGRELRRRRVGQGLSLADLASRSGLTANFIGSVELGKRNPSLSTMHKVARALEAELSEFFQSESGLSAAAEEAAHLFHTAPPSVHSAMILLLRSRA